MFNHIEANDKQIIINSIIDSFSEQNSIFIQNYLLKIEELKNIDLLFEIRELYEKKLIKENPIEFSNEIQIIDKKILKL